MLRGMHARGASREGRSGMEDFSINGATKELAAGDHPDYASDGRLADILALAIADDMAAIVTAEMFDRTDALAAECSLRCESGRSENLFWRECGLARRDVHCVLDSGAARQPHRPDRCAAAGLAQRL